MSENEITRIAPKLKTETAEDLAQAAILEAHNDRVFGKITDAQLDQVVRENTDGATAKKLAEAVVAEKARPLAQK